MTQWIWAVLTAVALFIHPSCAFWYEGPKKFTFLPLQSYSKFNDLSTQTCNVTLAKYTQDWDRPASPFSIKAACQEHQDCILQSTDEGSKAYMATSQLVLGFAPILLSTAGPTLSEIGLLALERPGLASLISLGTAAVYPSRVLGHEDDSCRRLLKRRYRVSQSVVRFISQPRYKYIFSAVQYVLVLGAVANILSASWQLGVGSVVTFRCSISLLPLAWVLAPALIYAFTSFALIWHRRRMRGPRKGKGFLHLLRVELSPCVTHEPLPSGTVQLNTLVMVFHGFSAMLGFLHVMFGILIFSSLLFTMLIDAAAIIFRYFASVLVCRTILIIELEGMRYVHQQKENKPLLGAAPTYVSVPEKALPPAPTADRARQHRGDSDQTLAEEPHLALQPPTPAPFAPHPPLPPFKARPRVDTQMARHQRLSFDSRSPHDTRPSPNSPNSSETPESRLPPLLSDGRLSRIASFEAQQQRQNYSRPRPSLDYRPPPFQLRPSFDARPFDDRGLALFPPRDGSETSGSGSSTACSSRNASCSPNRGAKP